VLEVIVPFPPGDRQIVLPVIVRAIGFGFVATFTALLLGETHDVVGLVPIT
jgi:hypothetical protein